MFESFHRWLNRTLRIDAYQLRGDEIIAIGLPRRRIRVSDLRSWQSCYIGGGALSVCVEFEDGRKVDYSDRYEQLCHILHEIAADKEFPFSPLNPAAAGSCATMFSFHIRRLGRAVACAAMLACTARAQLAAFLTSHALARSVWP